MNQTTMDYLFGPLPEIYCLYFYGMSVFTFILLVFALVNVVYLVFSKKTNKQLIVPGLFLILSYFLMYIQNRLLNTMCEKTL